MPVGFVSFERKVLPLENRSLCISYPNADFWSSSLIPLCQFEVIILVTIKKGELIYLVVSQRVKCLIHND